MARKGLVQIWVRGDKEYRKLLTEKAESLGYKSSEYARRLLDFGMNTDAHFFFNVGDDLKRQQTTNDPE